MNDELNKCYELLGVAPGVSAQELKAAYRDLAKVWHPDRFAHDPRLQQKAQEKLKEINEAYDQLLSGKTGRRRPETPSSSNPIHTPSPARSRRSRWQLILLAALVSGVVFFAAFRTLIPAGEQRGQTQTTPTEQAQSENSVSTQPGNSVRSKRTEQQQAQTEIKSGGSTSIPEQEMREVRALPTVTVMIDPVSGMLARADCPVKSRMTYPAGAEPQQSCNVSHQRDAPAQGEAEREKQSRLKTFAKRLVSPTKLFGGRGKTDNKKGVESPGGVDGQNR